MHPKSHQSDEKTELTQRVPKYFIPKSFPTIPAVGGTVLNQVNPKEIAKM